MADELQMKDLQMKGLTEKLSDMLSKVSRSKRKELDLQDINARLKEFQMALDSANIEMRHLGNHPAKVELKQMLREHKAALKELQTEYQTKRAALLKTELLGDHVEDTGERDTAEGLMERGLDVQQASKESLARTLATIERTKDVGADTVLKLEANTKQVEAMYDELEMIESSLQRSSKIIRRIARKMATDKYVWVMIILLLCVIIIVVVLNQLKKSDSGSDISSSSTGVAAPGR